MNAHGVLVTQSGACSLYNFEECFTAIHNTLKNSFDCVKGYSTHIPSFAGVWGFNIAYNKDQSPDSNVESFDSWDAEAIDERIAGRFDGKDVLKFYDGATHRGMFGLSKPIRQGLEKEQRIITVADPVFMY